jgi:hypothetical protein
MHTHVSTWPEFKQRWDGVCNFLMGGECIPFDFPLPALDRVVEELRRDELSEIGPGRKADRLLVQDASKAFRAKPIDRALAEPFSMAHYRLSRFDAPGKCLHGFGAKVLEVWQRSLAAPGFTWTRCYPIIFISGIQCATNYHMDFSHVLAWQVYGTKRFCGLKEPDRWASREVRLHYKAGELRKPAALTAADALCYDMHPGDALWNVLLTPHWVEASNEAAMSINISHGGLRLDGKLCPHEQELEDYRRQDPEYAPPSVQGRY